MTQPLKLHRHPLSGNSHRVQLFLSLLGLPFEVVDVDMQRGAHKQPAFLEKNPFGQIPVLEDGDVAIADSIAILVYLALRYDAERRYYPDNPVAAAKVQRWLSVAAGEIASGPALLRVANLYRKPIDRTRPEALAAQVFAVLQETLSKQSWLVGDGITIADIALYTYTAHAPEGGLSLASYPAVQAWLARIEALPNFVAMQRLPLPAKDAAG